MRLDAFLVADFVATPPDGKVYLQGGGFTKFTVPHLPYPVPGVGVVIRLETSEEEFLAPHEFRLTWRDPAGGRLVPPLTMHGQAEEAPVLEEGEERYIMLAINMQGMAFQRAGLHRLELHVDDEPVRSLAIPVVVVADESSPGPMPPADPPQPNRAARRAQERGKGRR